MEASFVSRAKTAFHSAAAKAEKVFTDIKKSDLINDPDSDKQSPATSTNEISDDKDESKDEKNSRRRPPPIKAKQDWQERFKNIRIGKRGTEGTDKAESPGMAYAIFDENICFMSERAIPDSKDSESGLRMEESKHRDRDVIPPASVMKQLAVAVEAGKRCITMKDFLASSRGSSPIMERASLSLSAVKSLMLREKDDKFAGEFGADDKVLSLINLLLDAEGHFPGRKVDSANASSLPKDLHGAPPESFIVNLADVTGHMKSLRKMALLWCKIVAELRRLWSEGQYIPGIPPDQIPDLNSCLLYQQLQVINRCISRKKRRIAAAESLDSVVRLGSSNTDVLADDGTLPATPVLYAKVNTGELILRLGVDSQSDLTMLETGEPIYTPVMQEEPLLTEDLIKETEELVLRTGSLGAGCSQLLSDMQAFKAANPGCILEDFVRWHSPPDWMECDTNDGINETLDTNDSLSGRGQLSTRMQKEGNLWRELWETSKPVPAVRQTPLFDEDLAVESILDNLEDISPHELFKQLFISLLGSGFVTAEAILSNNSNLAKLFSDCKEYVIVTCERSNWVDKVDELCQVYETVETMVLSPDEVIRITFQPEEPSAAPPNELKRRFKRLSLIFRNKDKLSPRDQKNQEESPLRQPFSSMFSKKPPKPDSSSPDKPVTSVENDWTIV
ncbi:rab3 GTPase-activating protein catalytic subunit [Solanum tuberosum]|uniref:Rab3GAP catalytic subunit conserved domain-containing protein n=2 Tax=Solanum tuberosum TaxID=4113 RepID=M1C139_SOLTU|nr:PREDICTED: rab3 GTPase-activating protein catalytic subunit [Solanum tuberosum]